MSFDSLAQSLVDAGAAFVVIGGWAAILNGSVRTTRDIDVCYERTRLNCAKIATALAPFHPRLRDVPRELPFVWDAAVLLNASITTLSTDAGPIDLLAEVPGLGPFHAVKESSTQVRAFDRDVWSLNLRGLIAAKLAAGRPKDIDSLSELESLLEAAEE